MSSNLTVAVTGSHKSKAIVHCTVGSGAAFPAYDPVNGYIYVPVESNTVEIVKAPCKVIASVTFDFAGAAIGWAAFDPQNNYVYVTDTGLNQVYVLSGTGYVTTVTSSLFDGPEGIVYDPAAAGMLVANFGSDTLVGIDSLFAVYSILSLPSDPVEVSIDAVADTIDVTLPFMNSVAVAYPNIPLIEAPTTVYYYGTGIEPQEIAYDPATAEEAITNYGSDNLTVYNGLCPCSFAGPATGSGPDGICYSAVHQYLYVMNSVSNTVSEFNVNFGLVKTVNLGSGVEPLGCAYDEATGQMYVTGAESGDLYVLP